MATPTPRLSMPMVATNSQANSLVLMRPPRRTSPSTSRRWTRRGPTELQSTRRRPPLVEPRGRVRVPKSRRNSGNPNKAMVIPLRLSAGIVSDSSPTPQITTISRTRGLRAMAATTSSAKRTPASRSRLSGATTSHNSPTKPMMSTSFIVLCDARSLVVAARTSVACGRCRILVQRDDRERPPRGDLETID